MAVEHPDKAFELAASIDDPSQRAWALGMMASRLHESKSVRAKEALLKAVDALAEPKNLNETTNTYLSPRPRWLGFADGQRYRPRKDELDDLAIGLFGGPSFSLEFGRGF